MSWVAVWSVVSSWGIAIEKVVFDYQSLIGGLIAILAAFIAARPVWRQVSNMSVETNVLLRDHASQQIRRISSDRKWYLERLSKFNTDVGRRLYEIETFEGGSVHAEWAHAAEQQADQLLDEMQRHGDVRDLSEVESELAAVKEMLKKMGIILARIHRPVSTDQHDEDHSYTDEEWAQIAAEGKQAEDELSGIAQGVLEASTRLEAAFDRDLAQYQRQLAKVQASLRARL